MNQKEQVLVILKKRMKMRKWWMRINQIDKKVSSQNLTSVMKILFIDQVQGRKN